MDNILTDVFGILILALSSLRPSKCMSLPLQLVSAPEGEKGTWTLLKFLFFFYSVVCYLGM